MTSSNTQGSTAAANNNNNAEIIEKDKSDESSTTPSSGSVFANTYTSTPIDPNSVTFVDYRRPPCIKVLPPSKYKLWLLVFVLVYLAIWVSDLAHFHDALTFRGWISPNGAQFLQLCIVVFVMVYGALDVIVIAFTFEVPTTLLCCWNTKSDDNDNNGTDSNNNNGKRTYKKMGIGPWLQSGRIQWLHNTQYADHFVLECIKSVIQILEDGFAMFNTTHHTATTTASNSYYNYRRRHGRRQRRKKVPSRVSHQNTMTSDPTERTAEDSNEHTNHQSGDDDHEEEENVGDMDDDDYEFYYDDEDDDNDDEPKVFSCPSDDCHTIVKIEHRINPDKLMEYKRWQKRICRACHYFPGLISVQDMGIVPDNDTSNGEEVEIDPVPEDKRSIQEGKENDDHHDVEKGGKEGITGNFNNNISRNNKSKTVSFQWVRPLSRHSTTATDSNGNASFKKNQLNTVYVTFDNIDSLNDWMLSPRRRALMKQLEPLLAVPSGEFIQAEKAAIARDAFTNLAIQQGAYSPKLPPKKWKVWWITTLALLITSRWVKSFLGYYMVFWGLDQYNPRLQALVSVFITTFLNSYVLTPFLLFLFNPWLHRGPNEVDERFLWKTLDDGINSVWLKAMLTAAFYGGCIVSWIVQTYA